MPDDNDQPAEWRLAAVSGAPGAPGNWNINLGDSVSDDQYASYETSAALLDELLSSSSFGGLQTRYIEFKDIMERIAEDFANGRALPQSLHIIERSLENLLTALRRFDDRTSHALSQRYGGDSPEFATFKEALSCEFDNVFAYRFAWHLRNYTDHQQSAISRITEESRLGRGGIIERHFLALFDGRVLLADYQWHRSVRRDLERINGEFPVEPVVDMLKDSCNRAYCKMLLAQEPYIAAAVENIRSFTTRATPDGNPVSAFVQTATAERTNLIFIPISTELADVAEGALQEARAITA